jgi:hypothetical protein
MKRYVLGLGLLLAGCPKGTETPDAGEPNACDTAPTAVHGQLLLAPTDSTVVKKTPTHPPLVNGELP